MKIIYIKNQKENFLKELEDIKLNNNIRDRFKIYQYLKKNLKSKIEDFYLFYDKDNVLNCFIEFKNYNQDDNFTQYNLDSNTLKDKSPRHIKNMLKGHPIFQEYIYNKINDKDIINHLDKIMEKTEKLKN